MFPLLAEFGLVLNTPAAIWTTGVGLYTACAPHSSPGGGSDVFVRELVSQQP